MLYVFSALCTFRLGCLPTGLWKLYSLCSAYFACTVSLIIVTNIILVHFEMPLNLSAGPLHKEDCATSIEHGSRPGESKLDQLDTGGIWDYMMKPIVDFQEAVLRARERDDLMPLVARYNTFVLLLGMVRPTQVDGVWDLGGLVYNAYPARLVYGSGGPY